MCSVCFFRNFEYTNDLFLCFAFERVKSIRLITRLFSIMFFCIQENKTAALPPLKKISQSLSSRSTKYITADDQTHAADTEALIVSSDLSAMQRSSHQVIFFTI